MKIEVPLPSRRADTFHHVQNDHAAGDVGESSGVEPYRVLVVVIQVVPSVHGPLGSRKGGRQIILLTAASCRVGFLKAYEVGLMLLDRLLDERQTYVPEFTTERIDLDVVCEYSDESLLGNPNRVDNLVEFNRLIRRGATG